MRLLDLFCGAGGAAYGYHQAGFTEIVGIDIAPQPRYPYEFVQADALELGGWLRYFDAIHASPPCQAYSDLKHRTRKDYPDLIAPTRAILKASGRPWVIENVEGAPLEKPIMLCGTQFPELKVLRHRLFESSTALYPPSAHSTMHPRVHTKDKRKAHYGRPYKPWDYVSVNGGGNCTVAQAAVAMQIGWMTKEEMNEAIPPAYTRYIGGFLVAAIEMAA